MLTPTTCLLWDSTALEAAQFYVSLIPNSEIIEASEYPDGDMAGQPLLVRFDLGGRRYELLNAGQPFAGGQAVSIRVECADQAEIDHLWQALTSDGGQEGVCGWCQDRFGLWWQISPIELDELSSPEAPVEQRARVLDAVRSMGKLDIAELRRAAAGWGQAAAGWGQAAAGWGQAAAG